ncbi:lantibiotic dehydratase [Streptosporangium sp. NBC_01495]|uniref:lantibiotic dehydratase n=1 Tax=Streptosporangium sp. NBC_01495 TaxID=2903899 RepID=UPI002E33CCED|nr:lantibiotic dehydratase [Streptosporangium sp. NBC_01495]
MDWLRQVWAVEGIAEALDHASPVLAAQVRTLCAAEDPTVRETRRAVLSVARYLQRIVGRATPFGLLAGVAPAAFGAEPHLRWGSRHHAIARAGAEWLADVIVSLERCPELLARLPVVANTTLMVRGSRLIVPYQPRGTGAVETSLRRTPAVRAAIGGARAPIRLEDLGAKIQAEFPAATPVKVTAMLTELVARGALITSLRAPSTSSDALGYLLEQLESADAMAVEAVVGLNAALKEIHTLLEQHNRAPASEGRGVREDVAARMRRLARTKGHPLAMDLRLDAKVVLPCEVAREVERAALFLTRLSPYPYATPAWRAYHQRFYERFGLGAMVPLLDVVSDGGTGWPDGYPGTVTAEQRSPLSSRDEALLTLAQAAALDGHHEVVLDEALITTLELGTGPLRPPPHLELGVRVYATDQRALRRGDFRLEVVTVSRAAGVMTGRFLSVLQPQDRAELAAALADLPGGDRDTVAAQLSFPPLDPSSAHVTRTPRTLPIVISLAEHRTADEQVLTPEDLAVACDGRRMYLAAPALGQRLEAVGTHALNLQTHTPPLARFLTELNRAQCAQVMTFQWGAAERLPFLPRLRVGRTILSPARWRLEAAVLPGRAESWTEWDDALLYWRIRRHLPRFVYLAQGDRRLPLDLNLTGHRVLLRTHLNTAPHAVLVEASAPDATGWCDGRAHEVVVPLIATQPPRWPRLPKPTSARITGLGQGQAPAASRVLLASLYGNIHHQDAVLTEHLPDLLDRLGQPANWWYIRYRDPDHHLRLRVTLPDPDAFGPAARTVSTWAEELHRGGLLREVAYPTSYRETGRWGSGPAIDAAEAVFGADSRALLVQLGLPVRPHHQSLVAAHTAAIAVAFTGSVATGMRWLIDHVPATAPGRVARPVFTEAVRITDPRDDWAALRAAPGGAAIVAAWKPRDEALASYRTHLSGPDAHGIDVDDVLGSLMHVSFVRACGIDFDDEAVGMYLARAAALAWRARTSGNRS